MQHTVLLKAVFMILLQVLPGFRNNCWLLILNIYKKIGNVPSEMCM